MILVNTWHTHHPPSLQNFLPLLWLRGGWEGAEEGRMVRPAKGGHLLAALLISLLAVHNAPVCDGSRLLRCLPRPRWGMWGEKGGPCEGEGLELESMAAMESVDPHCEDCMRLRLKRLGLEGEGMGLRGGHDEDDSRMETTESPMRTPVGKGAVNGDDENERQLREALKTPLPRDSDGVDEEEEGEGEEEDEGEEEEEEKKVGKIEGGISRMSMQDEERARANQEALKQAHNHLGEIEDDELDDNLDQKLPDLTDVVKHMNNKDYFQAAESLKPLCEAYPKMSELWKLLGAALFQQKRYREAAVMYRVVTMLKHEDFQAHINAGNSMLALGRSKEAFAEYDRVVNHGESLPDADHIQLLHYVKLAHDGQAKATSFERHTKQAMALLDQVPIRVALSKATPGCSIRRGAVSHDERLHARRQAVAVNEQIQKMSVTAQGIGTASMLPTALQVKGLLVAGDYRAAATLCSRFCVPLGVLFPGEVDADALAYTAAELWVLHARALHLQGDVDGALDILERALSEGLLNVEWKSEQLFAGVEVPDFGCVRLPPRATHSDREYMRQEVEAERQKLMDLKSAIIKAEAAARIIPTGLPRGQPKLAQQAVSLFNSAIKLAPWHDACVARLLYGRGLVQFESRNYTGAVDDATDSLRRLSLMSSTESVGEADFLGREQVLPLILRARAKKKLERFHDALDDYQTAVQILPSDGDLDLEWLTMNSTGVAGLREELERELRESKRMASNERDEDDYDDMTGAQRSRRGGGFIHTVMNGFYFRWGWPGWDSSSAQGEAEAGSSSGGGSRKQRGRGGRSGYRIPRGPRRSGSGEDGGFEYDDYGSTDASEVQKWCELLGIDREATRRASLTEAMVKSAFKKKSLETHPDKNPDDPKATENFQQINIAKDKLLERL